MLIALCAPVFANEQILTYINMGIHACPFVLALLIVARICVGLLFTTHALSPVATARPLVAHRPVLRLPWF